VELGQHDERLGGVVVERRVIYSRLCSVCSAAESATANGTTPASIPEPVVKIDNESDPFATIVSIEYGDRLGELLDTVRRVTGRQT
jgi:hypothetical protein